MIPVLHGVWASGGLAGDFEHIETQTVGAAGAASVTFSSIPGTYKHIEIRYTARTAYGFLRFNGDTNTANYRSHALYGDGATVISATNANNAYLPYFNGATYPAAGVVQILDYASTSKNKTIRSLEGLDQNGSGFVGLISNLWMSTSAITSITLTGNVNFTQYTTFSLYGVK